MIIKVCGLTPRTPLEPLGALPIHWGGLVFVPRSPRYAGDEPFDLPAGIERVGVFVDQLPSQVQRYVSRWNLDRIQLNGRETPSQVAELRACGCAVVKTIVCTRPDDLARASRYEADYLRFDGPPGGAGRRFDWNWLATYTGAAPFLLAGGIGPEDAPAVAALEHPRLAGFDLDTRFEREPGVKDVSLLNRFLHREVPR